MIFKDACGISVQFQSINMPNEHAINKFNSLTTNFQKLLSPNSVGLDEVAHHEPPHPDLRCLQFQLFSSLVLIELMLTFLTNSDNLCSNKTIHHCSILHRK